MDEARKKARVLIVDDNRVDADFASEALASLAQVSSCESAERALRIMDGDPPEIVLSDLNLPGLDGLEFLSRVAIEYPGTEFILTTADTSPENAIQAMRGGAADYFQKPIREDDMRRLVARVIERQQLRQENDHLRTLLSTMDDCRSLAAAVEPAEIHAIALDVLLRRLNRSHGIAIFRGNPGLGADDVVVRGFSEQVADTLRSRLARKKRSDQNATADAQVVKSGAFVEAIAECGISASALLVVPMDASHEDETGYLLITEDSLPFDTDDLEIARMVAAYGQVGVYNAERYLRAKERAFVDDVTGAYNARYLFAALEHELRRAERYESALTVIFLDIDRFKLVNDEHGHLVGSRTLRALTEVLGSCIRQVDTLARYGGDEFTILLADTPHETGQQVAERIRTAVARNNFEAQAGSTLQITVSIGVASFPDHAGAAEALLDAADKAMYRAKSLGRNQVCSANDLESH